MNILALESLDLAALVASRVCHDVISPVGAIVNGLEVLEEDKDEGMREFALDLIRKSAKAASARLQFCRLAFGAAGSAGAAIDTGDAEKVARGLFADDRTQMNWTAPRVFMAKNKVKLALNLCLIAAACIPRGGVMNVAIEGEGDDARISVAVRVPISSSPAMSPTCSKAAPKAARWTRTASSLISPAWSRAPAAWRCR